MLKNTIHKTIVNIDLFKVEMLNNIITVLPIKKGLATSTVKNPLHFKVLFNNDDFFMV